jgi:predicted nuclease of predicted toxin-antitoxin system
MKGYYFDENVPSEVPFDLSLPIVSPASIGASPTDSAIWEFATRNELVIVSKDADFSLRIILKNPPPWVVHLRFGNLRRAEFEHALGRVWPEVERLLKHHKLVNVFLDRVEGVAAI